MSLKQGWGASALLLAFCTAAWAGDPVEVGPACGSGGCAAGSCPVGDCATGNCGWWGRCCCPKICFPLEKPPCIKFKCICPKPVCEPCNLDGYGYYATCWHPWPYPPNCGYYPAPAPGAVAVAVPPPLIGGPPGPATPGVSPDETLPPPQKTANPNPNR